MGTLNLASGLDLPLEAVTQKFAFLGRSGSGKTYAAGKLLEGMLDAGAQVVVLDPVGNWWGLRVAADGKGPGIAIPVFGGERGDVPLEPGGGQLMADLIVDKGCSAVLDVSMFRKGQRKDFVTAFAEQLFHRKKSARSPLHLLLEEAQVFCPQRVLHGEERLLGAIEDIVKQGRNYGIGSSLVSQRPQAVNKDCLNQVEVLVVLQTAARQERDAIEAWIDERSVEGVDLNGVKKLPVGTAFVWSPQWLQILGKFRIATKRTFDASATPKFGQKIAAARTLAPVELAAIREAMKAVVERAAENDPIQLKRRIAELERRLAAPPAPPVTVPAAPVRYVPPELLSALKKLEDRVGDLVGYTSSADRVANDAKALVASAYEATRLKEHPAPPPPPPTPARSWGAATPPVRITVPPEMRGNGKSLGRCERALLAVLAQRETTNRTQLAVLSGYSQNSSGFANALGTLRSSGLAEGGGDAIRITETGRKVVGPVGPPLTGRALIDHWMRQLGKCERAVLEVILHWDLRMGGRVEISRDELAKLAGYSATSSGFANALGRLRTLELVQRGTLLPCEDLRGIG